MIEPDVEAEISFHIEGRVQELVRSGWNEDAARAQVREWFGDRDSVEALCRRYDAQRVERETWRQTMEAWGRDARLAVRSLTRDAGFTTVVLLMLSLGIGATTAVFSVIDGILLSPLPFPDGDRLAVVWQNDRATGTVRENASTADYYDYLERNVAFEDLAIFAQGTAVLLQPGADALQLNVAQVSSNLLDVLGSGMQLGRGFTPEEDQPSGPSVVILTNRIWRDLFAADPEMIGRVLSIDDLPHEVVGVLPAGIDYPAADTDIWVPIQQSPTTATRPTHWIRVLGRMHPGTSIEAAQADMARVMTDLEVEYPNDNANRGAFVERLSDVGRGDLSLTIWVLFGAVLAVLAIACVNVANLLLARGVARSRELAVLRALGAGAGHITRRFFLEGLAITLAACALGTGLAALGVRGLTALAPANLVQMATPEINAPVLGFALGVSLLICLGFGLLPTFQARGMDLQQHLKSGRVADQGAIRLTARRLMVSGQLALAVVLLIGATLLIGTVRNLQSIDPGFRAESSLRADFVLPDSRYPNSMADYPDWPEIHAFMRALIEEAEATSGVRSAAVVLNHPLDPGFTNSFRIEGQTYDPTQGEMTTRIVTPTYFETAGVSVLEGRPLDAGDRVGTPDVILLNQSAVDRYFPDGDAVGNRIGFWGPGFREVVGVVQDERINGLTAEVPPAMYVSMFQAPPRGGKLTLMLRSDVPPLTLVDGVRAALRAVDPDVPVFNISTMENTLADAMARERFASTVLGIFAAVALLLAILGVHGVLAYLVSQRGHELGVRMALGASRHDMVRMVVRQGLGMAVVGVLGGLLAAVALSGLIQGLLFGVSAVEPLSYLLVASTLTLVALLATALPAYQAGAVDPSTSLRGD